MRFQFKTIYILGTGAVLDGYQPQPELSWPGFSSAFPERWWKLFILSLKKVQRQEICQGHANASWAQAWCCIGVWWCFVPSCLDSLAFVALFLWKYLAGPCFKALQVLRHLEIFLSKYSIFTCLTKAIWMQKRNGVVMILFFIYSFYIMLSGGQSWRIGSARCVLALHQPSAGDGSTVWGQLRHLLNCSAREKTCRGVAEGRMR